MKRNEARQLQDVFLGMVGRPHQGSTFHKAKAHLASNVIQLGEDIGMDKFRNG